MMKTIDYFAWSFPFLITSAKHAKDPHTGQKWIKKGAKGRKTRRMMKLISFYFLITASKHISGTSEAAKGLEAVIGNRKRNRQLHQQAITYLRSKGQKDNGDRRLSLVEQEVDNFIHRSLLSLPSHFPNHCER